MRLYFTFDVRHVCLIKFTGGFKLLLDLLDLQCRLSSCKSSSCLTCFYDATCVMSVLCVMRFCIIKRCCVVSKHTKILNDDVSRLQIVKMLNHDVTLQIVKMLNHDVILIANSVCTVSSSQTDTHDVGLFRNKKIMSIVLT